MHERPPNGATTANALGSVRATSAAFLGGVTGSSAPVTSSTGAFDRNGAKQSAGTGD